ncbi:cytochrome b/b6 domain-containing protein [Pseudoalteromonas fenneropenaei]|uniref:Cytochrome b/b6 domain-containing protein n=1 Tax=Pseudoalteromonas fenneropenaei TaxID=1737459 RepID=A0ABV7CNX3_9GAMM
MTKVWDGFIRGFHWLLVLGLAVLYVSGEEGWMDLHFVVAYLMLALFITRLIWGGIGSQTARLSSLFHRPQAVIAAVKGDDKRYGHNAAGSYMVLLFFVLIAIQLVSGLMSTDDILVEGPLVSLVPASWVELAGDIHHETVEILIAAIVLHIAAIVIYRLRGKNLVKTLLTGKAPEQPQTAQPVMRSGWPAYVIFVVLAGLLLLTWGAAPLKALFA